jgi:hypothetical protein
MPAAPAAVPQQAAGAILPAFMAPQGGGAIARMVSALYGQSVDRFRELATTDVTHMAQLYGNQEPTGTSMVFAHAMGVTTGPCAFLTILPVTPGNQPVVSVIHCVRQYIRSAADGTAATNDPLNNRTFVFMGDCFPPQLPAIKMEPSTGIIDYGQPMVMPVPNDGPLAIFYQGHGDEELVPRRTATTQQDIRQVIYLPVAWIPAFIDDLPPKIAWDRALALQALMAAGDRAAFQPLVDWTKAACLKKTAAAQSGSQLAIPWREVRTSQLFVGWATSQLANFYPGIYHATGAPPAPGGNPFAGFSAQALAQAIQQGMATGMAGMAQGMAALAPVQPASTAGSWTPLQQTAILKGCGLPQGSAWNHPDRPQIWEEYEAEGRTADGIGSVLRAALAPDYNDPAQDDVFPYISYQVAKDIKRCHFGGDQALTAETCDRGLLPIAVQPRSMGDRMSADADEEEYEEVSFKTSSDVRSKRQRQRKYQKAPGEYHGLVACLRAQVKVTELHFGPSPLATQLNEVHHIIKTQREFFEALLTPRDCAGIVWTVSLHTKAYYDRPYQNDGTVQPPQLFLLLAELRNHRFGVPVTMPPDIMAYQEGRITPHYSADTPASDGKFGESAPAVGRYRHTPDEIKAFLADIKTNVKNLTIAQLCAQAPQPVTTKEIILAPGHCVDWMALGSCKRSGCSYKHDQAVRAEPDKIKHFLKVIGPAVDNMKRKRKRT